MNTYNETTKELDFHFQYPIESNPVLAELRAVASIDLPDADELEKAKAIIGYAHKLFTHNGGNEPSAADPLTILQEAKSGKSFRCVVRLPI